MKWFNIIVFRNKITQCIRFCNYKQMKYLNQQFIEYNYIRFRKPLFRISPKLALTAAACTALKLSNKNFKNFGTSFVLHDLFSFESE